MNLFIHYYHHVHGHSEGAWKGLLAMYIIINVVLIGIMIVRAIVYLTKKQRPKIGLFEYCVFSTDVFVSSSIWGMSFFIINGIALLVYLMIVLVPYL